MALLRIKRLFFYIIRITRIYIVLFHKNENGLISEDSKITFRINEIPIIVSGCKIDVLVIGLENEMHSTTRSGSSFATAIFSGYLALYIAKNNNKITPKIFDQVIEINIYNIGFIDLF